MNEEELIQEKDFKGVKQIDNNTYQFNNTFISKGSKLYNELIEWSKKEGNNILKTEMNFNKLKEEKLKEVEKKYTESQLVKIYNGITFYIELRGELYNNIIPKRIQESQKTRFDDNIQLFFIQIKTTDGNLYKAEIPLSFYYFISQDWDKISLANYQKKLSFLKQINETTTQSKLKLIEINFLEVLEINLEEKLKEYLLNEKIDNIDKEYIISKQKEGLFIKI